MLFVVSVFSSRRHHQDPRTLAPSFFFGMSLEESKALLDQYKAGALPPGVSDDKLWAAKKIKVSGWVSRMNSIPRG